MEIITQPAPSVVEVEYFTSQVNFPFPYGLLDFLKESNGADIYGEEIYVKIWSLTEMIKLNEDYGVAEFIPEFFIFGSDGGNTAFAIEKDSGRIFNIPFIEMTKDDAAFVNESFIDFLSKL